MVRLLHRLTFSKSKAETGTGRVTTTAMPLSGGFGFRARNEYVIPTGAACLRRSGGIAAERFVLADYKKIDRFALILPLARSGSG